MSLGQGQLYKFLQKQFKKNISEGMTSTGPDLIKKISATSSELKTIQNNMMDSITNYGHSINKKDNPYLGQNIQFGPNGPLAYVTDRANLKWYNSVDDYYKINGKNGCPTNIIQITDPKFPAPLNLQLGQLTKSNPILTIGNPMTVGQSCGYEGANVRVTNYINNPTSTLLGCYNSSPDGLPGETIPSNMTEFLGTVHNNHVNSCSRMAANKGYQYFGLTNTPNSWITKCFGSNDLTKATSFGNSDNCIANSDTEYIGESTNNSMGIYQINEWISSENMGKIGYVDDDTNLSEYPTSMITYTYTTNDGIGNKIIGLPDIPGWQQNIKTLADAQQIANTNPKCTQIVSVTMLGQGQGQGQGTQTWYQFYSGNSTTFRTTQNNNVQTYKTYIKTTNINSDTSCSKKILNIDTDRWNNYTITGQQMNPSTKCGISNILYGNDTNTDNTNTDITGPTIIEGLKIKIPKTKIKISIPMPKISIPIPAPKNIINDIGKGIDKGISEIKKNVTADNIKGISKEIFDKLPATIKNLPATFLNKVTASKPFKQMLKHLPPNVRKSIFPQKKTKHQQINQVKHDSRLSPILQAQLLQDSILLDQENKKNLDANNIAMATAATQSSQIPGIQNKIDDNNDATKLWLGDKEGKADKEGKREGYSNMTGAEMNNILQDSYISVNYGIYTYLLWNIIATIILLITIEVLSGRKWSGLRTFITWIIIIITCNVLFQYYSIPVNILVLIFYILYKKLNKE